MYHKIDLQENERNKMTNEERGKHMKRKKLVAILLTAAMTAGMLAGCGSSGGSTGGTSDSKASSESTASSGTADNSSEEEGEDLAFKKFPEVVEVHVGQGVSATDTLPDGLSVDNNQYTDYLLENFNIKVVVDWTAASGNDYTQKVALCIASNTLPDAMTVSREYMLKAAKAGQLYDLTDLFQKVQSDQVKEVMDSTDGQAIAEASVDGRQYAIPAVEVETGSVQVLNVRQDWLDEYGLDAPKTLDDVENIAKVFAEKKPAGEDTIPLAGPDKNTKCYTSFLDTGTTTGGFDAVFTANGAYPGLFLKDDDGNVTYGTTPMQPEVHWSVWRTGTQKAILILRWEQEIPRSSRSMPEKLACSSAHGGFPVMESVMHTVTSRMQTGRPIRSTPMTVNGM